MGDLNIFIYCWYEFRIFCRVNIHPTKAKEKYFSVFSLLMNSRKKIGQQFFTSTLIYHFFPFFLIIVFLQHLSSQYTQTFATMINKNNKESNTKISFKHLLMIGYEKKKRQKNRNSLTVNYSL